jgi:hypothetical protein
MRYVVLSLGILAVCAGCGNGKSDHGPCGVQGTCVKVEANAYCAYIVIEGGFKCPDAVPFEYDFAGGTVCASADEDDPADLPDAVCAEIPGGCHGSADGGTDGDPGDGGTDGDAGTDGDGELSGCPWTSDCSNSATCSAVGSPTCVQACNADGAPRLWMSCSRGAACACPDRCPSPPAECNIGPRCGDNLCRANEYCHIRCLCCGIDGGMPASEMTCKPLPDACGGTFRCDCIDEIGICDETERTVDTLCA